MPIRQGFHSWSRREKPARQAGGIGQRIQANLIYVAHRDTRRSSVGITVALGECRQPEWTIRTGHARGTWQQPTTQVTAQANHSPPHSGS